MCFGFSTNFSKKTVSSPNAFNASRLLSLKAPFNSADSLITRIPLPPPPEAAFSMIGYPMISASLKAVSIFFNGFSLLLIIGMLFAAATSFAVILSPRDVRTDTFGPTKIMSFSSHF